MVNTNVDYEIYIIQQNYKYCQQELLDLWNNIEESNHFYTMIVDYNKCISRREQLHKTIRNTNRPEELIKTLQNISTRIDYLNQLYKNNKNENNVQCEYVNYKLEWKRIYSDYCKLDFELSRLKNLTVFDRINTNINSLNLYKSYWTPIMAVTN